MDRWLMPRRGESNLAWRANSNVLTFTTINERMDLYKGRQQEGHSRGDCAAATSWSSKDIVEGL